MRYKVLISWLIAFLLFISNWFVTPTAWALTPLRLSNLNYKECPPELLEGNVSSGGGSFLEQCFLIYGKVENTSGKPVVDADVFGLIFDADGNNIMENRGRIGTLAEVPAGTSDFEFRVSVPASQPTPLTLKKFKATGFDRAVRPYYYTEDETESF
jgi:hypothetical protein